MTGTLTDNIKRTMIASEDIPNMAGFESRIYLVEYPPGVEASPHVHSEQCVGYVLEGRFESAYGDGPVVVKHAGEGFVELPNEPHRFRNPDRSRPLRFIVAGSFRKNEPLFQLTPENKGVALGWGEHSSDADQTTKSSVGQVLEVKRTLLAQKEIAEIPGLESRIYLIEFPPSAESKLHVHTAQGIGYVLEGSFESAFGDNPTITKHAGEAFVDRPGLPHHFRNPDSAQQLRFLFSGTFHKDEPIFQVVAH